MTQITGARKLNYKDFVYEAPAGAGADGQNWTATTPNDWSIGLGSSPGVPYERYDYLGYRYLLASSGAYSRKYTNAPGVNDWWHTEQVVSGKRLWFDYDFGFRAHEFGSGVYLGWMIEHSAFTESVGYRLKFDGLVLTVEKIDVPNGVLTWTDIGHINCALDVDKDYYVRITYCPADFDYVTTTQAAGGMIAITITDDFKKRGIGTILDYVTFDTDHPLQGSTDTVLMVGGDVATEAEFWGIIYTDGFIYKSNRVHHYSSMGRIRQDLMATWPSSPGEMWDYLENGDRFEFWVKERYYHYDFETEIRTDYWMALCVFDGRVYKVHPHDDGSSVDVYAMDELSHYIASQSGHYTADSGVYADYDEWFQSFWDEVIGLQLYPQRLGLKPGYNPTTFALTALSATYLLKGTMDWMFQVLLSIVCAWMVWNNAVGCLVAQRDPIMTGGRKFTLIDETAEMNRIVSIGSVDMKKDQYATKVDQYHDDGAGAVTVTSNENATDKKAFGPSDVKHLDLNVPPIEGAQMAQNRYNQLNDNHPVYDVFTYGYGLDLYPGCQVGLEDPSKDADETTMTIIEQEWIYDCTGQDKDKSNIVRHRLSYQESTGIDATRLPRYEESKVRFISKKRKEADYVDMHWT